MRQGGGAPPMRRRRPEPQPTATATSPPCTPRAQQVRYLAYMRPTPGGTTEYLSLTVVPDMSGTEMSEFFADDGAVRGTGGGGGSVWGRAGAWGGGRAAAARVF